MIEIIYISAKCPEIKIYSNSYSQNYHPMELSPLLEAARNGELKSVIEQHKKGADLNETAKNGSSALIYAAEKGHFEIVKYRSEEHTSELQSRGQLVCRPLLE